MVAVCVDDGADFEVKQLRLCDGYAFAFHGSTRFSELGELEFTSQFVCDELDHLFHVLLGTGVTNPVVRFAVLENQEEASA